MLPGLVPGSIVIAGVMPLRVDQVVIAKLGGREVVKRLHSIKDDTYVLRGDNTSESVDSREFGPVKKDAILGVVMITLPVATDPPATRRRHAVLFGIIAAAISTLFALVHLFRIDTWLPLMDIALPGSGTTAAFTAALLVIFEVFALPFLLRMKLSPLMRFKSGLCAVLVPLMWLLIAIWNLGFPAPTGQLGEFVPLPSSWYLIVLNGLWLAFTLWTLKLLGFEKAFHALRKHR